ncbi:MAG: GTP-binding protein [Bacteroidota bacterium]
MSTLPNSVVLRPRFQLEPGSPKESVIQAFETAEHKSFLIRRIDDHVFIKFVDKYRNFWSPQLQLEVNELDEKSSRIYGLFGPNPTLWTFFMFLHFGVATFFIILGIWAYSNAALDHAYGIQLGAMVFLVLIWFTLYFFGRSGKRKGRPQMNQLYNFMQERLNTL